jgi:hypothetical protein
MTYRTTNNKFTKNERKKERKKDSGKIVCIVI